MFPLFAPLMFGAGSRGGPGAGAVDFGGAEGLQRGANLTGAANSAESLFAIAFRLDAGDGTNIRLMQYTASPGGTCYVIQRLIGGQIQFNIAGISGTGDNVTYTTAAAFAAGSAWRTLVFSCKTDLTAGNKLAKCMVDGVADAGVFLDIGSSFSTQYTTGTDIFLMCSGATPSNPWNGCVCNYYYNNTPGCYMDVTQLANYNKFFIGTTPVDLGDNGENPTGAAPIVYQHIGADGDAADFKINLGTGGGMTEIGTITACSSTP